MRAANSFVWYDLMTSDIAEAKKFYTELAGWKTQRWTRGEYDLLSASDQMVGGIMRLPKEDAAAGRPPHWLGYIDVASADATAEKAKQLGGKVMVPPRDIPEVGRFSVMADPQGAAFAVIQSLREDPAPDRSLLGGFSWAELNTTDYKAAWKFYSELFGWKASRSMDMGPELGEYFMFSTHPAKPEETAGGMSNAANMMKAPPHWLHYFNVKSVDDAAKRIPAMGGTVLNGPMEVPGGDRIAQCMDPQGGMFAIFSSGKR